MQVCKRFNTANNDELKALTRENFDQILNIHQYIHQNLSKPANPERL